MSTGDDNSILLSQACESGDVCPLPPVIQPAEPDPADSQATLSPPIVPQAVEEKVPEPQAADAPARPKKAALLTEIARLSLEGHSNRAIGRKLGVPARTVDRWVGQLRQQWAENFPQNYVELHGIAVARLETAYREAMEAWRGSLQEKLVTVEALGGGDDDEKTKGSLRKTTQSGQAALLGQAIHAAIEISKFNSKHLYSAQQIKKTENPPQQIKKTENSRTRR